MTHASVNQSDKLLAPVVTVQATVLSPETVHFPIPLKSMSTILPRLRLCETENSSSQGTTCLHCLALLPPFQRVACSHPASTQPCGSSPNRSHSCPSQAPRSLIILRYLLHQLLFPISTNPKSSALLVVTTKFHKLSG